MTALLTILLALLSAGLLLAALIVTALLMSWPGDDRKPRTELRTNSDLRSPICDLPTPHSPLK